MALYRFFLSLIDYSASIFIQAFKLKNDIYLDEIIIKTDHTSLDASQLTRMFFIHT